MEDSENSSNNFSFQSFDKEKFKAAQSNNYKSIGSFVSKNNTYQSPGNSNNLEDIIFKELKENEKSYLDNGIYFKRKIEGSNPNTKRGKENSLFNSKTLSEIENNNISRSDQLLDLHKHSFYKSFNKNSINQYSPNKNYIPDSESEEEKEEENEEKNYEEKESESSENQNQESSNNNKDSISIRISNPIDINNNNISSKNSSNKLIDSKKEIISSLKDGKLPIDKRFSLINNFSKLNSILTSRNTVSYSEKQNYSLLSYIMSNNSERSTIKSIRNTISSKKDSDSINYSEQAKIIQKWWRNVKRICDDKINKIIKIQSVWRGKSSRKETYDIIYLCYSSQNFYDIISRILTNKARKLFWWIFFSKFNTNYYKIKNARKLYNRYQYIKPFFEKWKCLNKLLLFRIDFNEKNSIENYQEYGNEQMNKIQEKYIKLFYLDSIYLKFRMNRIRYTFDCINNYIFNNNINFKKYQANGNNNSIKRYFLYKWRYIIKNLEIKNLRGKLLNYCLIKFDKKSHNNILFKYFSRWKLIFEDEKNKTILKNRIKKNKKEKTKKNKILKELINLSIKYKKKNYIIFIRALIRKWRFLIFAKKITRQKLLKMYENVQKTYGKIFEDIYDMDKKKLEKFKALNNNNQEDEKNFVEHINKIYNEKMKNNFKYKFNMNNNK